MAKGSKQAQQGATDSGNFAGTLRSGASSVYNTLAPQLTAQATHPMGMSPTDLAAANTAAQQSAGGSQAAAVGQGGLLAARTRNAGGAAAAIGEASRGAGRNLSEAALGTQLKNATLKEQQRGEAQTGLGRLYSTNVSGANEAAGEEAKLLEANEAAKGHSFWGKLGGAVAGGIGKLIGGI